MNKAKLEGKIENIHFIGIGGIGMSALAKFLILQGKKVTGSDLSRNSLTTELENFGAKIYYKHSKKNLKNAELVVYTSAIDDNNSEIREAKKKNIPLIKRSELLGEILNFFRKSIAISGSHGKTTTSAMITSALKLAGKSPTCFIGGEDKNFSNFLSGKNEFCVVEACEYKKNFLSLSSNIAVVLNMDNDHLDCYKDINEIKSTFQQFIMDKIAFVNADDINCKGLDSSSLITFGIKNSADYMAKYIKFNGLGYSFTIYKNGIKKCRVHLKISGKHNVYNALSVFAVCDFLKIDNECVKNGLEEFNGVKRRTEYLDCIDGTSFYADYAHHPTEINATLKAFKERNKKILILFEPHTYSRTKFLMQDFINCFKNVGSVGILKTYPAREKFMKEGSALELYNKIKIYNNSSYYLKNKKKLEKFLKQNYKSYDLILCLGAGDIYFTIQDIIKRIKNMKKKA